MNSFLASFKDSILLKIIIAIITFFYSIMMNAQVEKSSELFKILAAKKIFFLKELLTNVKLKNLTQ